MIKKLSAILLSFIFALILIEAVIGNILNFPKYGVKEKIIGIRSSGRNLNIYQPFSKYWTANGNFEIFKRNNIGLPGIDVDIEKKSRNVCVLGSSFIENNYQNPEVMSTSVLQKLLKKIDNNFNVLNLGYNGCDPYDSYRVITYYENKFDPESVILVINSFASGTYKLNDNPFAIDISEFKKDNSFKTKFNLLLRNNSAFARLLLTLIQNSGGEQVVEPEEEIIDENSVDLNDLQTCLIEFNKKYGNRFICISIMRNEIINRRIKVYCDSNNINFSYSGIMIPENQISGDWHLNEKGNIELGNFIFSSFCKYNNLTQ